MKEIGFTISEKDKQHVNKPDMFHLLLADISLKYKYGRLVLEIPLPSRNEKCLFFLRPMLMSVGDLIADVQREDPGVTASVFSKGGSSSSRHTYLTGGILVVGRTLYDVNLFDGFEE